MTLPSGERWRAERCPAELMDYDTGAFLDGYTWLKRTNKTPVDMGLLSVDEMDPRFYDAVSFIEGEMNRITDERRKRMEKR